jgi:hypothetical protein
MKIKILFLAFVLSFTNSVQAQPTLIEQLEIGGPTVKNTGGYTGVYYEDTSYMTGTQSGLIGMNWNNFGTREAKQVESFVCRSYSEPNCSKADEIVYHALLDECTSTNQINCIQGVVAIKSDGTEVIGKKSENYPDKSEFTFKGDSALNIPDGGLPSLWTFDGVSHQGGDKFLLFVKFSKNNYNDPRTSPDKLTGGIFPVSIESRPGMFGPFRINPGKADALGHSWYTDGPQGKCLSSGSKNDCAIAWPHPENIKYRLDIRTNIGVSGFMHGRMQEPSISITNSGSTKLISIEASPVKVPIVYTWKKNTDLPENLNQYLNTGNNWIGGAYYYSDGSGTREGVSILRGFENYSQQSFDEYLLWLPAIEDKSTGSKSLWVFRTLSNNESNVENIGRCFASDKDVLGVVTTNAGVYISAPPTFNSKTQTLDYKVASPHYDESGNENIGTYNLVLRSDRARCLYGFTNAPISATVSVLSSGGGSQAITTTVNEKNGWLYLSANGFKYSSPVIKVKLQQAKNQRYTISCIKGKVTKKVTGTKPKCPVGYKLKSS